MRLIQSFAGIAFAAATLATAAAFAQESSAEVVVVTGSRLSSYDAAVIPHVTLKRRADHVITTVTLNCDTRERERRLAEIKDTLRAMMRAASAKGIALAINQDDVVRDLKESMFDDVIRPDSRPDSSFATVVLKTAVTANDTFETATARLKDLIANTEKVGRTEVTRDQRWDLTLVAPERNRDALMKEIVDDAHHAAGLLGPSSAVQIEGLQRPVEWYRSGPLELALYIPYNLTIAPK